MSGTQQLRDRTWHYLNPDLAGYAGTTVQNLQQFAGGTKSLDPARLNAIAMYTSNLRERYDAATDTLVAIR
jgi:hypothetical protein